ncbi:MAG: peptidoglycan-binding protein [Terriglobales bacterium]
MHRSGQIRRWRRVGFCGLLCLAVQGLAIAQTSTTPKKPAHASAAATSKTKHPASGHATSKRTSAKSSSRTSAHTSSAHSSSRTSSRTSAQSKNSHGKKGSKQAARKRGQQVVDSDRAREIQEALIRERYMQGEPTGSWDDSTQAAMQRYQADQGWQSKTTPDSRALIKLGLGPSHDHLLNPESAMTTATPAAGDPKTAAKPTPADSNLPRQ